MLTLQRFYLGIIGVGNFLQSLFLLLVRLFWGWFFFSTGMAKLMNIDSVANYFTSLNIPMPLFSAYLASYIEVVGGACLFFGLASRLVAIPLIGNMVVAYLTAEFSSVVMFLTDPMNFITRTPFTFLYASLLIFIFGPGRFSIDYLIEKYVFPTLHRKKSKI